MSGVYNGGVIDAGRTWTFVVQNWRNSATGEKFNLDGHTAKYALNDTNDASTPALSATTGEVESDGTIVLSTTGSAPVTANSITIQLPASATESLLAQRHFYELVITLPSGDPVSLLKGWILVSAAIA